MPGSEITVGASERGGAGTGVRGGAGTTGVVGAAVLTAGAGVTLGGVTDGGVAGGAVAAEPPPVGSGLAGVCTRASTSAPAPSRARAFIWRRIGSSLRIVGTPIASMASSTLGKRSSAFLPSIRSTAASISGGQSGRSSRIGRGGSLKCCHITPITESAWNGTWPVSIS
jgi:hypothetical protein